MSSVLGYELLGTGDHHVVVLHDWLCDTSTWTSARPYLDQACFSWAFVDLRGYGRSRDRAGTFDVLEAAADVLAVADDLGWSRFSLIGHSMSTYVAMHLGQHESRIQRIVLITPPPPRSFGASDAWLEQAQSSARNDVQRAESLRQRFAGRLSQGWAEHKIQRWLATSNAEAAAGYIAMFARDGLPAPSAELSIPVLAITGEEDAPVMRKDEVQRNLAPLCTTLDIVGLLECGHYPMEEMPPRTVALVEGFLRA